MKNTLDFNTFLLEHQLICVWVQLINYETTSIFYYEKIIFVRIQPICVMSVTCQQMIGLQRAAAGTYAHTSCIHLIY